MSGLLALLDDVTALTRLAASQVDDVVGMAAKAGSKAAGVVIDDAAVTPKYVTGLPAARELPIVWKIGRASLFNKIFILLPAALLLDAFAPWLLTPLLMLGGAYLCFEGAEKVWHWIGPGHGHAPDAADSPPRDPEHLERERVAGAIKTDFILSAEIMTITLSAIEADSLWMTGVVLAVVGALITVAVYGVVGILVKADDVGLRMAASGRFALTRGVGRAVVRRMPLLLEVMSTVGTLAMLWVGGHIIVAGLAEFGVEAVYDAIHRISDAAGAAVSGFAGWSAQAGLDGLFGLVVGLVLIPIVTKAILPVAARIGVK